LEANSIEIIAFDWILTHEILAVLQKFQQWKKLVILDFVYYIYDLWFGDKVAICLEILQIIENFDFLDNIRILKQCAKNIVSKILHKVNFGDKIISARIQFVFNDLS
jgi:hypothetical protein